MAKIPRRQPGWKYSVDDMRNGYQVTGPGLTDYVFCSDLSDAEMVAASLNLATNFDHIKSVSEKLKSDLEYLSEFK